MSATGINTARHFYFCSLLKQKPSTIIYLSEVASTRLKIIILTSVNTALALFPLYVHDIQKYFFLLNSAFILMAGALRRPAAELVECTAIVTDNSGAIVNN